MLGFFFKKKPILCFHTKNWLLLTSLLYFPSFVRLLIKFFCSISLNITAPFTPASSWNAKGLKLNSLIMKECLSKPPQIKIFPHKSSAQSATADKSLDNLSCIYVQRGVLWVLDGLTWILWGLHVVWWFWASGLLLHSCMFTRKRLKKNQTHIRAVVNFRVCPCDLEQNSPQLSEVDPAEFRGK